MCKYYGTDGDGVITEADAPTGKVIEVAIEFDHEPTPRPSVVQSSLMAIVDYVSRNWAAPVPPVAPPVEPPPEMEGKA
jgi:hypothetical protein